MAKTIIKPPLPILDRSHPLAKPLVACYPVFERGGTTLHDISGKNNHGTLTNMDPATDWVKTPMGSGLKFDGVNDHVLVPHTPSLSPTQFTIEAWIQTISTTFSSIVNKYTAATPNYGYDISINLSAPNQINMMVDGTTWTTANFTWDSRLHQIIGSYDGTTVKIYGDSILLTSQNKTHTPSNAPLSLGSFAGAGYFLNGTLISARIWNRAMLNRQIAQLYADPWAMYRTLPLYTMGSIPTIPTLRTLSLMGVGR
ncbi:MAG: LamG domain-containing protein [Candidatus Omnitrophica bacterium]|nr:LamG domain-containing protein [Candidatus Omnitrophota bacterium]